ncbi:MAG: sigma-70 family RNA polymerase sigma factor [bacterium]|nr:sigma-70 family RNA polymerase sigma factor [bacterium]
MPPAFWKSSDKHIVTRVLRGKRDAFGELVERYLTRVHAVAYARTSNRADAEEAAQEAFLQAFTSLDRLKDPSRFGPWLLTIARRTASSHARRTHRDSVRADEIPVPEPPLDIAHVQQREIHGLLHEELARLEETQREILLLYYFGGRNTRETAEFLGISVAAARKRLQRAREALGTALVDRLGDALQVERPRATRTAGIMAAIATAPVAWKAAHAATGGLSALLLTPKALVTAAIVVIAGVAVVTTAILNTPPSGQETTTAAVATPQTSAEPEAPSHDESRDVSASPDTSTAAAEESPRELQPHECLLKGRVVHADTGEGIPHVRVMSRSVFDGRTDAKGAFEVVVHRGTLMRVAIEDDTYALAVPVSQMHAPKDEPEFEMLLEAAPGASLSGRIFDVETKEALPDVELRLETAGQRHQDTISGPEGTFSFERLPPGRYEIETVAEGHVQVDGSKTWVKLKRSQRFEGLPVPMQEGIVIAGIAAGVSPERYRPHIEVRTLDDHGYRLKYATPRVSEDGAFSITLPKRPGQRMVLWAWNQFDVASPVLGPFDLDSQDTKNLKVDLVETATIEGTIVDPSGRPLRDAYPRLFARGEPRDPLHGLGLGPEKSALPDSEGRFCIEGMPPGEYWLFATTSAYTSRHPEPDLRVKLSLRAGQRVEGLPLDCHGAGTLSISGVVVDPDGKPVRSARVCAYGGALDTHGHRRELTDKQGRFRLDGLLRGEYKIEASMSPYLSSMKQTVQAGGASFKLALRPAAEIELTVLNARTGKPVPVYGMGVSQIPLLCDTGTRSTGATSILRRVHPGVNTLRVKAEGYEPHEQTVHVGPGPAKSNRVIVRLQPGAAYRGVVLSPNGEPVSGATVAFELMRTRAALSNQGSHDATRVVTDAEGRFAIKGTAKDGSELWAYHRNYWRGSAQATPGRETSIMLQPAGRIEGRVTVNGEPARLFYVTVRRDSSDSVYPSMATTLAPGGFVLAPLPPGTFTVDAKSTVGSENGGGRPPSASSTATQLAEVVPGRTTVVDFSFSVETGAIGGRVTVDGAPAKGATVGCRMQTPAGEQNGGRVETDADGRYRIEDLQPGTASLYVRIGENEPQGMRIERVEGVTVKANRTTRQDIRCAK